jgi:hypothetical protein
MNEIIESPINTLAPRFLAWISISEHFSISLVCNSWRWSAAWSKRHQLAWRRRILDQYTKCVLENVADYPNDGTNFHPGVRRGSSVIAFAQGRLTLQSTVPTAGIITSGSFDFSGRVGASKQRACPCSTVSSCCTGGFVGYGHTRSAKMLFYPIHDSQGQLSETSFSLNSGRFRNILHAGDQLLLIHHDDFWRDTHPLGSCVHLETEKWVHFSLAPLRDLLKKILQDLARREGSTLTGSVADVQQQAVSATDNHFVFHLQVCVRGCV